MDHLRDRGSANPLRRYLAISLVLHALAFAGLSRLVISHERGVAVQGKQFVSEVRKERERQRREQRQAVEEAVKDRLAEELETDMDNLVADELDEADEQALSEMTTEDIERLIDELDREYALDQLDGERYFEISDEARAQALEDLRRNLREMKQDLFLSQVRAFIRTSVAPDIQQRIDKRLKDQVGRDVEGRVDRTSRAEKRERLADAEKQLREAAGELKALERVQRKVDQRVHRGQLDEAAQQEQQVREKEAETGEKIDSALKTVQRVSPSWAEEAAAARKKADEEPVDRAVRDAHEAIREAAVAAKAAEQDKENEDQAGTSPGESKAEAERRSAHALETMQGQIKTLDQLASELKRGQRQGDPDPVQQAVVDRGLREVEDDLRREVTEQVTRTAVPVAAERIVRAVEPELKKRKLDDETFREFVEKDIHRALAEGMDRNKPDADQALARTRERYRLRDSEALKKAGEETAEIAERLRKLARDQRTVREESGGDTSSRDARRQRELARGIEATQQAASGVFRRAGRATLAHGREVERAANRVADREVVIAARRAGDQLDDGDFDTAREQMAKTATALERAADEVASVSEKLQKEAKGIEPPPELPKLASALGEEAAKKAVADVESEAGKAAEKGVEPAVAAAARHTDVRGAVEGDAFERFDELEEKLDQVAANLAEGRGFGVELGMGILGPGQGLGLGGLPGGENLPWTLPQRRAMSRYNRKAYEAFVKEMRDRLNPENYYGEPEPVPELDSVARADSESPASIVFVESLDDEEDEEAERKEKKRSVPKPDFPCKAFGAAAMMEKKPTIDGDLSDWGELRHGLTLQYRGDSLDKVGDGPTIYVRWSPDGFYFGYDVPDPNGIQPCKDQPWSGDCLEVMIDTANSRLPRAYKNQYAQKFCFTPFGCRGSKDVTVWEMGRGLRGLRMAHDYPTARGSRGARPPCATARTGTRWNAS